MRLIECHAEGFGKLVDKRFTFDKELNCFCFENGHGKTTLADFIKAMLYGLDSCKSNSKNFEDRLHYYPFSGARFGGSLTLISNDAEYRIERFFDKKSRVKDTLKVYKNGRETNELGEDVGESLLGLDRESFERTLFANSRDEFFGSTDGINAKLNNFSSVGDGGAAGAITALEKAKRTIKAAKGSNDLSSKAERERLELLSQIANLDALSDELGKLYKRRELLTSEIKALEASERERARKQLRAAIVDNYKRYKTEIITRQKNAEEINSQYGGALPSSEDLSNLRAVSSELAAKKSAATSSGLTSVALAKLDELNNLFGNTPPSEIDIDECEAALREKERLTEKSAELAKKIAVTEAEKRALPIEAELEAKRTELAEYKRCRAEIENLVSVDTVTKRSVKAPLLAVGIALAAVSIPFAFFLLPVFFALIALGGVLCLLSVEKGQKGSFASVRLAELRAKSESVGENLKLFLAKYGFFTEGGIIFDFSQLEHEFERSAVREAALLSDKADFSSVNERLSELSEAATIFFTRFNLSSSEPFTRLSDLRGKLREYYSLTAQKKQAAEGTRALSIDIDELCSKRNAVLSKYGIPSDCFSEKWLDEASRCRQAYDFEISEIERTRKLQEAYGKENEITDAEIEGASFDAAESFGELLDLKRRELASLDREISEIEERVQYLPEKQSALELSQERISYLKERLNVISKTQEFIRLAEENILERFVGPVMASFKNHLSELSDATGEQFSMDLNFNLKFNDCGEMRDEKHLSSGQRTIVDLALRLALADALFGSNGQFVILDDTFLNLDEFYMEKVKKYLYMVSKRQQIVYFCCHSSRKI